ncbi:MAG: hypothetical protein JXB32_15930 [Deltaproteobacteria bacterium]|nr:hypothetical protein [Deltaproteobacteria bacterium]
MVEWLVENGHLPEVLDSRQPRKVERLHGGKDGMIDDVVPALRAGTSALIIRDADDDDPARIQAWFVKSLAAHGLTAVRESDPPDCSSSRLLFTVTVATDPSRPVRVGVVIVGDPGIKELSAAGGVAPWSEVTSFAMDDYLVRLLAREDVYGGISELKATPYAKAFQKLDRFTGLLRDNGLPVQTCKRLLGLLHGITGYRASPATFAERLLEKAAQVIPPADFKKLIEPLVSPIRFATEGVLGRGKGGR